MYHITYLPLPEHAILRHAILHDGERCFAFNNRGHVTGSYHTVQEQWTIFLYDGLSTRELVPLSTAIYHPHAIHDDDTVVGQVSEQHVISPFVYAHKNINILELPRSASAVAGAVDMNEQKHILIQVDGSKAFVYTSEFLHPLNSNTDQQIQARAINNYGSVVGGVSFAHKPQWLPFCMTHGEMHFLELPSFSSAKREGGVATAINNHHQVIGTYGNTNGIRCSFLNDNGKSHVLPDSPNKQSRAVKINDNGVIIGFGYNKNSLQEPTVALIWRNKTVANLNDLINERDVCLLKALDINEQDEILCLGTKENTLVLVILSS